MTTGAADAAGCATGAGALVVGAEGDADEDVLVPSWTSGTKRSFGAIPWIARARLAATDVFAAVRDLIPGVDAAVLAVEDGDATLEDEPEPFSSFGSWKASSAAKTTIRPTRMSFFRRSARLASLRRLAIRFSRALIRASFLRQPPNSKRSRMRSPSPAEPQTRSSRCT
jgi:hypothetical protein